MENEEKTNLQTEDIEIEGLERDFPLEEEQAIKEQLFGDDGVAEESQEENSSNEKEPLLQSEEKDSIEEVVETPKITNESNTLSEQKESTEKTTAKNKNPFKNNMKLIIIVLITLITAIIIFILFSSSKEEPTQSTEEMRTKLPEVESYKFKLDHISIPRINEKLELLTKYELLGVSPEEYEKQEKIKELKRKQEEDALKAKLEEDAKKKALEQKLALEKKRAEEEKLALEKKKALEKKLALEKKMLEEKLALEKAKLEKEQEEKKAQDNQNNMVATSDKSNLLDDKNKFLGFIQINTNKKAIYKSYLIEVKKIDSRVNPCRNIDNSIQVFIGPLNKQDNVDTLINSFKQNKISDDVAFVELTKEEFATRCNIFEN